MRLFINEVQIHDFEANTELALTFAMASVTDIDAEKTGYSKTIKVPITPANTAIFGHPEGPHSTVFMNQTPLSAVIDDEGVIIAAGSPMLQKSETVKNGSGYYHINVIGAGKEWSVQAAKKKLSETGVDLQGQLFSQEGILNSWQGSNTLLRWVPVVRAPFSKIEDHKEIRRAMDIWDYHPFIHAQKLFEQIFIDSGYRVVSKFLEFGGMDELYISGYLNRADIEEMKKNFDFFAGGVFDKEVKATTAQEIIIGEGSNVSPIFRWPIVYSSNENSVWFLGSEPFYVEGAFDNKGIVSSDGERCWFKSSEAVSVGFKIEVNHGSRVEYVIQQNEVTGLYQTLPDFFSNVRCRSADYDKSYGPDYRALAGIEILRTPQGGYMLDGRPYLLEVEEVDGEWAIRVGIVLHGITVDYVDFEMMGDVSFFKVSELYEDNLDPPWVALVDTATGIVVNKPFRIYEAYDRVDSTRTFDLPARRLNANENYYFGSLAFSRFWPFGATSDFTYYKTTNITPVFPLTGVGIEEIVTLDIVLSSKVNQASLLKSVKHLFNLNIYTDAFKKVVFIEPRDSFYTGPVVDWSDKLDLSKPVEIQELGDDVPKTLKVKYKDPDYTVEQFNNVNMTELGTYSEDIRNQFAKTEDHAHVNELFAPSIIKLGAYYGAPDASLLHANSDSDDREINFETRVVKYIGIESLPEGQAIGFPEGYGQYPLVAFMDKANDVNLCFEDRDALKGLHTYYAGNVKAYNLSKRITCYMHLKAVDVESFARLNDLQRDFRATFRIKLDGEYVYCILESINDYNNSRESTKCVFVKKV